MSDADRKEKIKVASKKINSTYSEAFRRIRGIVQNQMKEQGITYDDIKKSIQQDTKY